MYLLWLPCEGMIPPRPCPPAQQNSDRRPTATVRSGPDDNRLLVPARRVDETPLAAGALFVPIFRRRGRGAGR